MMGSNTGSTEGSLGGRGAAEDQCVRVLYRGKIAAFGREPGLYWLIGSPLFLPPFTVIFALRCLHHEEQYSPDFAREADYLRTLLLRGLDVVGALFVGDGNWEENASKAIEASLRVRQLLFDDKESYSMIGAATDLNTEDIQFFVSEVGKPKIVEALTTIVYQDYAGKYLWEIGCLIRCELAFKLPVYVPLNKISDAVEMLSSVTDDAASNFRDPHVFYLVEGTNVTSDKVLQPIVLRGAELDFGMDLSNNKLLKNSVLESNKKSLPCSYFCSKSKHSSPSTAVESADTIRVSVLSNSLGNSPIFGAPVAEYFPTSEPARLFVASFKLDVLCYASKDIPVASAVTKLIIPGLIDQLASLKKVISPKLFTQQPQLCPYHFSPPGILHPITAIYELSYGETEAKQVETRRSLHLRLGLPLDRPLLLIANALTFGTKDTTGSNSIRNGFPLLKDVHTEISSGGVSGGLSSFIQGSYEYHHYLQDGFDDSGWGCAYRSLQTIISWFRLQHYTSIEVPSHREIQQALVEIGDKEPSFVGSREWIGAIELSFVLDKLLGVSCKIMNVRSGTEIPERCRELALHFETQGTPVMIGGGVLAYTLLGVDYNDASGDCAFLILDHHYTGNNEHKKIVNGGWCGWKKAVDSKGKNFFLSDKFYNLLLHQRPNMV